MIRRAKSYTSPGTHIYLVGRPQYEAGHECSLAGTGGGKWTDDEAKKIAADTSVNQDVSYLGTFKLDSTRARSRATAATPPARARMRSESRRWRSSEASSGPRKPRQVG